MLQSKHNGFFGGLEQRSADDIKAHVRESRGDNVGPTIVAVLPHFCDEQFRLSTQAAFNRSNAINDLRPAFIKLMRASVDALNGHWGGRITSKHEFHRVGNFTKRGACARRIDSKRQKVCATFCAFGQCFQRRLTRGLITRGAGGGKAHNLPLTNEIIINF